MSRLSNLLARIHRDGGHYEAEYGTGKAVHDADVIIADLNAERDERQATEATLSDHDLSLIEERCGFGVYERVQRLCGIENRAHTVLNSDISGQQSNLTATYILTGEGKKYVC